MKSLKVATNKNSGDLPQLLQQQAQLPQQQYMTAAATDPSACAKGVKVAKETNTIIVNLLLLQQQQKP